MSYPQRRDAEASPLSGRGPRWGAATMGGAGGSDASAATVCAGCGGPGRPGARFCTACGGSLATDGAGPPPQAMAPESPRAWAPVPGPEDRRSFFEEQRRRRRQTWRISAVCALTAIVTGVPLGIVLTPVLAAVGLVALKLVTLVTGVPALLPETVDRWSRALLDAFSLLDESNEREPSVRVIATAALLWLLPGMLAMLALWLALRGLFLRAGAGAVVLTLGARPPRPADLEERQLVNVVEEMAIAAGVPPPRVLLLDCDAANAAIVGSRPEDATLIVTRPLLDAMDRDATQGVLANLIGSAGNGDLRIALSAIAVYQTFGVTAALLKAPLSGDARRVLLRLLRFGVFGGRRGDPAVQAETITRLLGRELTEFDTSAIETEPPPGTIAPAAPSGCWKVLYMLPAPIFAGLVILQASDPALFRLAVAGLVLGGALWLLVYRRWVAYMIGRAAVVTRALLVLPYYIAVVFPQFLLMIFGPFLLGPVLGWLWRTRRYLADATAVQLTRNPDGLARGLLQLGRIGSGVPGGAWAAPLFVVGPRIAGDEHALTGGLGSIGGFHPPTAKRLARLRSLGATVGGGAAASPPLRERLSGMPAAAGLPLAALVVGLSAVVAVLMTVVVALMLAVTLAAAAFLMLAVLALARVLFG